MYRSAMEMNDNPEEYEELKRKTVINKEKITSYRYRKVFTSTAESQLEISIDIPVQTVPKLVPTLVTYIDMQLDTPFTKFPTSPRGEELVAGLSFRNMLEKSTAKAKG